jgi:hypothetical protein
MKAAKRPAYIDFDTDPTTEARLNAEFRAARFLYHRLLDFEDQHQAILDTAAEVCAPGILEVGRIVARINARYQRKEKMGRVYSAKNPVTRMFERTLDVLEEKKAFLVTVRNADPRWKEAMGWRKERLEDASTKGAARRQKAKAAARVRQKKDESDEVFAVRFARETRDETEEEFQQRVTKRASLRTREEEYHQQLYDKYCAVEKCTPILQYDTWNALKKSLQQARSAVLKQRRLGLPAKWRRPKWDGSVSICSVKERIRIVSRGKPWWVIQMKLASGWVQFRAKIGNWHHIPEGTKISTCQLKRVKVGRTWKYWVSLTVDVSTNLDQFASRGAVSLDWGHREYGHSRAHEGLRVFTWMDASKFLAQGDSSDNGEIILPIECRHLLDEKDALISRLDTIFNERKKTLHLRDKNRHTYRKRLQFCGVRTEEEENWLKWENRKELQLFSIRNRIDSLREETYMKAVRMLRRRFRVFVFEDEKNWSLKKAAKEEQTVRRRRQNRDLSAKYKFKEMCERSGAEILLVPSRNSTRECPYCGNLDENTEEILLVCSGCGRVRDKDYGACMTLAKRAEEELSKRGS